MSLNAGCDRHPSSKLYLQVLQDALYQGIVSASRSATICVSPASIFELKVRNYWQWRPAGGDLSWHEVRALRSSQASLILISLSVATEPVRPVAARLAVPIAIAFLLAASSVIQNGQNG